MKAKGDFPEYIHTPGGSPRNADGTGTSKYTSPSKLPEFTTAQNSSDVNNGKTADKPAAEKGGMLYSPGG